MCASALTRPMATVEFLQMVSTKSGSTSLFGPLFQWKFFTQPRSPPPVTWALFTLNWVPFLKICSPIPVCCSAWVSNSVWEGIDLAPGWLHCTNLSLMIVVWQWRRPSAPNDCNSLCQRSMTIALVPWYLRPTYKNTEHQYAIDALA